MNRKAMLIGASIGLVLWAGIIWAAWAAWEAWQRALLILSAAS